MKRGKKVRADLHHSTLESAVKMSTSLTNEIYVESFSYPHLFIAFLVDVNYGIFKVTMELEIRI